MCILEHICDVHICSVSPLLMVYLLRLRGVNVTLLHIPWGASSPLSLQEYRDLRWLDVDPAP